MHRESKKVEPELHMVLLIIMFSLQGVGLCAVFLEVAAIPLVILTGPLGLSVMGFMGATTAVCYGATFLIFPFWLVVMRRAAKAERVAEQGMVAP